ncbi:MAG: YraN family protein [Thermoanaerobaculia bacterium]
MSRAAPRTDASDRVLTWLIERGYRFVALDLRLHGTVVPFVVTDGPQTVFVVVKLVQRRSSGYALELIDRRRATRLLRAIGAYLAAHPDVPSVRIDVVVVSLAAHGGWRLEHYVNAVP